MERLFGNGASPPPLPPYDHRHLQITALAKPPPPLPPPAPPQAPPQYPHTVAQPESEALSTSNSLHFPPPAPPQYPYTAPQPPPLTPEALATSNSLDYIRLQRHSEWLSWSRWYNKETGGYCGRVQDSSDSVQDDSESTATGGGGSASVADSSIGMSVASESRGPAAAVRQSNLLSIIDESDCTHRAFYNNLYSAEAGTDQPPNGIEVVHV